MTETYLPVRDSIGYKNLKSGLMSGFQINLDEEKIEEFDFENFRYDLNYKDQLAIIIISSTEKNVQFQFGEGGSLNVLFYNPEYPETSKFKFNSFTTVLKDETQKEQVQHVFGHDEKSVEEALSILKDYLDSKKMGKYLPIEKSLGYKNLDQAMEKVFSMNLDDIEIFEYDFENFSLTFVYNNRKVTINIMGTEKNTQFNNGDGGRLSISLKNPLYPEKSWIPSVSLDEVVNDENSNYVKYDGVNGKDLRAVEKTISILKNYLDSQK